MYLESDLGLDSIKMIALVNELMKLLPEEQLETRICSFNSLEIDDIQRCCIKIVSLIKVVLDMPCGRAIL